MQRRTKARQRTIRLITTSLAATAVAGVGVATAVVAGTDKPAAGAPVAGGAAVVQVAAVPKKAPKATKYVFQNQRPEVGVLAAGQEVKLDEHLYFKTRGTQWAVISRVPGEPEYEPFGWRQTIGNDNLGDGTSPGVQSVGLMRSSVFKSSKAATVVYTVGQKAWYGKVYRLAGIPGWVESSVVTTGADTPKSTPAPAPTASSVSVFVYDAKGTLLTKFGDAKGDPLPR
jgi:hypothetical protein